MSYLIWYILLMQDNTDVQIWNKYDMIGLKSDPGSWVLVLVLTRGPGPGPWVLVLWEYYQGQHKDPGPDFSYIWQNNSLFKLSFELKILESILWPHQISSQN